MSFSDNYNKGGSSNSTASNEQKKPKIKWSFFVEHNATIFSLILLIVTVVVLFLVNVQSDNDFKLSNITAPAILLSVISYLFFVNTNRTGDKACQNSKKYKDTVDEYEKLKKSVYDKKLLFDLDEFCKVFIQERYKESVVALLSPVQVEWEDFLRIKNGENKKDFNEEQMHAIYKALKVKPIKLTRQMLMRIDGNGKSKSPIRSAGKIVTYQIIQYVWKAITIVCSLFFTFTLAYTFIFDFSSETIWRGIVQLVIVSFSIFGGLSVGWKVRSMWMERTNDISEILKEFFASQEKEET